MTRGDGREVTGTLAIVERAHRGAVEQQYAHVLWLVHALHRQSPMTLLLRALAVMYALDAPPPAPLRLAAGEWGASPDYRHALDRLRSDGATVLVSAASLAELGVADRPLHEHVRVIRGEELVRVVASHRRIWFL